VQLDSQVVSTKHARLVRTENRFSIEDLRSTNGVTVNGRRLGPDELQPLGHGDSITISDHVLLYVEPGSSSNFDGLSTIHVAPDRAQEEADRLLADLDDLAEFDGPPQRGEDRP
jgi:pSer/pThr/pTyr-binding forkhead associated (FHA) protein